METFELNGVTYTPKESVSLPHSNSKIVKMLVAFSLRSGSYGSANPPTEIDVIKEFGLIQQKKSSLSKSQRDWVVSQFKRNYRPVNI